VKRNAIVILVLIVGITLMLWSGVVAFREHRAAQQKAAAMAANHMALVPAGAPSSDTGAAASAATIDPNSPEAQGLPDMRGKLAPVFTLKTPDGKTASLTDYKGKAVLVNFWATWCAPCKIEMPWLIDLQKQYGPQGFTVLGISEDDPPFTGVAGFVAKNGMNYPVLLDDDDASKAYGGIDYLPTSYYIGRDGKIMFETAGLISKSEMATNIQKILATKGA
jgi:peroxiredoxin